jgi:hypothetical protein
MQSEKEFKELAQSWVDEDPIKRRLDAILGARPMTNIYSIQDEYTGAWRTYDENYQVDTDNDGTWSSESIIGYGATKAESLADYLEQHAND